MIWQNLWALTGLSLLAVPLLIHLLSRKRAAPQKFPSLRFLNVTRLLPIRSPDLSDIPLLLVRLAIVAAAVAALAQPLWVSPSRKQSLNASLARVIVVDTSRSMFRAVANGQPAVDSARALAASLATEAATSIVLQTATPSRVMAGAAAWLTAQSGRGEVVVLSDFQTGAVDSSAFAAVPLRYGVRAIPLGAVAASYAGATLRTARTTVTALANSSRISAEWTTAIGAASSVVLLSTVRDSSIVQAARDAANMVTSPPASDSSKLVAIVFPGATETLSVRQNAKAPAAAWMARVMMAVHDDEVLKSSVANESVSDTTIAAPFAVIARNRIGAPVVYAVQSTVNGNSRLTFFQRSSPSALSSAALIAAVSSSVGVASDLPESETMALSHEALRKMERAPQDVAAQVPRSDQRVAARSGISDGRWLWILVLALLGLETWMRRKVRDNNVLEPA